MQDNATHIHASHTHITQNKQSTFTVAATTQTTVHYQWQESTNNGQNWSNLANAGIYGGVNTNTLTISKGSLNMNNNLYRCVVKNNAYQCGNDVTSQAVKLTIQPDNDEDGIVDNKLVHEMLISRNATLLMFNNESEAEAAWMSGEYNFPNNSQLLFDDETIPSFNSNTPNRRFDASLEEVLHLITHEGYSYVYSDLKEVKGSSIAKAMDEARGGYFQTPPSQYPSNAWYSYDDVTCTYDCMIVEYFYWALSSLLGVQNYPGRFDEIGHEWKANTPSLLQSMDPAVYSILTDSIYQLPTVLPDGSYLR